MAAIKKFGISKKSALIILAIIIVFAFLMLYMYIEVSAALRASVSVYQKPSLGASIAGEGFAYYNNSLSLVPYSIVSYNSVNESYLNINTTLFAADPPSQIYVLDPASGCFRCGNYQETITYFFNYLSEFGVPNARNATVISNPGAATDNSLLVILSGYMPNFMFSAEPGTNTSVISSLLNRHVNIMYIGDNFSYMLHGSTVIPNNATPSYLGTIPYSFVNNTVGYTLKNMTFSFTNGSKYGPTTYENAQNGTIIAFPNVLESWPNPQSAGFDMARAVSQLFWLPKYSSSSISFSPGTSSYNVVMQLKEPLINLSVVGGISNVSKEINTLNKGYIRSVVENSKNYTVGKNYAYIYATYKPNYVLDGEFSMPGIVTPGSAFDAQFTVFTGTNSITSVQSYISIYNIIANQIQRIPLATVNNVRNNYTFVVPFELKIPPGNYIAELDSPSGIRYAAAAFQILPIVLNVTSVNLTKGIVNFSVFSGKNPISNVNYTLTINKEYPQNGTISNGQVSYELPKGSAIPSGKITFNFSMLSSNFNFTTFNSAGAGQNSQFIEIGVVAFITLFVVIAVKAPIRDDIYIDVPDLPPHQVTEITLNKNDVVGTFDKLNMYYHWKFMPLSVPEARVAISNYLRYNNMPVNLTLNNVDSILTRLVGNGDLKSTDNLYAPKQWEAQTGHDIEYLSTFKKLRMYMVTHAIPFTEIDSSNDADMIVTFRGEKILIVINSKTTKFKKVPVKSRAKTYIAFLNNAALYDFTDKLGASMDKEAEELRLFISMGQVRLIDASNPGIV